MYVHKLLVFIYPWPETNKSAGEETAKKLSSGHKGIAKIKNKSFFAPHTNTKLRLMESNWISIVTYICYNLLVYVFCITKWMVLISTTLYQRKKEKSVTKKEVIVHICII